MAAGEALGRLAGHELGIFHPAGGLLRETEVPAARAVEHDGGLVETRSLSSADDVTTPRRGDSVPVDQRRVAGDPVDMVTGEMVLTQHDVDLPGTLRLLLSRTHISSYRAGRFFGASWASTLDQRLEISPGIVRYAAADGMLLTYPIPASGTAALPVSGPRWPLAGTADGGYLLTVPDRGHTLWFPHRPGSPSGVLPLTAVTDRNGHRINIDRAADDMPVRIRHSGGYRIDVESDGGRVTALRMRDGDGGTTLVRYGYDDDGRLTEVSDAAGEPLRFAYDPSGRIVGWEDRNGVRYGYAYDADGRCVRSWGTGGFLTSTYDFEGRTTAHTDSLGHRTVFGLNEREQIVEEIDPLGRCTRNEWDEYDRLLSRTDPLGRTTRYAYDARGSLVELTRPDGRSVRLEYDRLPLPVAITDVDGGVWRRAYDERGNLTAVTDPLGATTTYTYDAHGNLSGVRDALGGAYRIRTDAAGLPTEIVDPGGAVTRYSRDAMGRVTSVTDPAGGVTRFVWDTAGRLTQQLRPDGTTASWEYDLEGNLVRYTDPVGRVTRFEIGPFDRATARVGPDGARLEIRYDTELRPTAVVDPHGLIWRYEYDAVGDLVRETDVDGRVVTYAYDAARRLTERTDGTGRTTRFVRDLLGNVVEEHRGDTVATFAYDPAGRLVRATAPGVDVGFERDPLGRVVAETCDGRTITSVYDVLGRRVERRTPSGARSTWEFGPAGEPVALYADGTSVRFDHDLAGRETTRRLGPGLTLTRSWDAHHRQLSQILTAAGSGSPVRRRSFTYGAHGRIVGVEDDRTGPLRFDLDAAGRVTGAYGAGRDERYSYDAAGRISGASWPAAPGGPSAAGERTYDGALLTGVGDLTYHHDDLGRVVRRERRSPSGQAERWRYTWDADDRLTDVTTPDGRRWQYRYDPLGRRVSKRCLGPDGTTTEQVDFVWDGPVLAEQIRTGGANGHVEAHATVWDYEPGGPRPICQREALRHAPGEWVDRRFYAIVTDIIGTPSELVDAGGRVVWGIQTTLWGAEVARYGDGTDCPLRFAGQYHDDETGLHYNLFRYYDPISGRYQTPDPLGLAAGPDPYTYVPNPLAQTDPYGLVPYENEPYAECDARINSLIDDFTTRPGDRLLVVGGGRAYGFPRTPGVSLNISRSSHPHVLGDIARPPFPDNAFDKVYFECIPYDAVSGENLGALDQTMRILRPGGSMLMVTGIMAPASSMVQRMEQLGARDLVMHDEIYGLIFTARK